MKIQKAWIKILSFYCAAHNIYKNTPRRLDIYGFGWFGFFWQFLLWRKNEVNRNLRFLLKHKFPHVVQENI